MSEYESNSSMVGNEQPNTGGLATADRQCQYTKSDGTRCRSWAILGQKHCFSHDRFLHARPERPIDIPLLEDEGSIVYVLSQALQALAWGTIPNTNARDILNGCRLAFAMQTHRLEAAKFRLKVRRLSIPENEIFDAPVEPERRAPNPEREMEPGARHPEPTPNADLESSSEPCASNPVKVPPSNLRFRDLKKNWDKELSKGEVQMTDMYFKRYGETPEDFEASHATPFENLAAEDLELKRVIAEAKAMFEARLPAC